MAWTDILLLCEPFFPILVTTMLRDMYQRSKMTDSIPALLALHYLQSGFRWETLLCSLFWSAHIVPLCSSHLYFGYNNVEGYVSEDEEMVQKLQIEIKNFACRFLKSEEAAIKVWTLKERLMPFDDKAVILLAAKSYEIERDSSISDNPAKVKRYLCHHPME